MKYPLEKYDFFQHTLPDGTIEIIAKSSYGKKTVKGKARCHPEDTFNEEKGKTLAALRCAVKITEKRLANAKARRDEAARMTKIAERYERDMLDYQTDAILDWRAATKELENFTKDLMGEN